MGVDDGIKYNLTMSEHVVKSYEDGFADGYSRAWLECWDYMRDYIANNCQKDEVKIEKKNETSD